MLQQLKKSIILADILSFIFGFLGVSFGILSLLALEPFWSIDSSTVRDRQSFALTATTICCDFLSVLSAMVAYYFGVKLYKMTKNENRGDKPQVLKCERYSFYCDFWSFLFGIVGLIFGITSFITLFPSCLNKYTSWWSTITSVCFDSVSCAFVGVAMWYFRKGIKLT